MMLFVCCHSARDARCGAVGPALAARLLALVKEHGLQDQIRVYKTSHVGGHKVRGWQPACAGATVQLLLRLLLLCSRGHVLAANGGTRFPASQQPAPKMAPTRKGIEKAGGMALPSRLSPVVGFRPAVPCSLPAMCWFMAPATPATATGLAASAPTMQRSF